ncbi:MAG: lipopolysaccharide transport periplasmic protein LptA [Arenimonas sp.]|nr:lipopolysaccharide transport periplasmic protein LptA [Arenimonas sp.]MBP6626351.1 lipopolysaccharide transport periplasmic protein LptA [Arenimonas sp.]
MRPAALSFALLLLALASPAFARSSDRQQPMDIDAANMDALLEDNAVSTLVGNVRIRQGSLEVDADKAEVHRVAGEIDRIVLTGSPVRLRQVSDQGEPMNASARQIVYSMTSDVMVFTGAVVVEQPRGTLRGETLNYNLTTGRIDGGGDGTRVSLRILPRAAAAPAPGN